MKNKKPTASRMSFTATAEYVKPKVYCKECKFYDFWRLGNCKYILEKKDTPIKKRKKIFAKSNRENANNDCPHFKKKWWRKIENILFIVFFIIFYFIIAILIYYSFK